MSSQQAPEIEFPVNWKYKIIVEQINVEQICQDLENVWQKYQKISDLTRSNQSKSGKYISLAVNFCFNSKDELNRLSTEISKTQGVKFLL